MGLFSKIMGTHSQRELKRIYPLVDKIEALAPAVEKLSDEELRSKTAVFKERLERGETLDDLLVEAFAVVREAAYRGNAPLPGAVNRWYYFASGAYIRDENR